METSSQVLDYLPRSERQPKSAGTLIRVSNTCAFGVVPAAALFASLAYLAGKCHLSFAVAPCALSAAGCLTVGPTVGFVSAVVAFHRPGSGRRAVVTLAWTHFLLLLAGIAAAGWVLAATLDLD